MEEKTDISLTLPPIYDVYSVQSEFEYYNSPINSPLSNISSSVTEQIYETENNTQNTRRMFNTHNNTNANVPVNYRFGCIFYCGNILRNVDHFVFNNIFYVKITTVFIMLIMLYIFIFYALPTNNKR